MFPTMIQKTKKKKLACPRVELGTVCSPCKNKNNSYQLSYSAIYYTVINGSFEHSIWTAAHIANMQIAKILKRQKVVLVSTSYGEKRSKRFVHFYVV
jgi:hypothetical protein